MSSVARTLQRARSRPASGLRAREVLGITLTWIRQPRLWRPLAHTGAIVVADAARKHLAQASELRISERHFIVRSIYRLQLAFQFVLRQRRSGHEPWIGSNREHHLTPRRVSYRVQGGQVAGIHQVARLVADDLVE